MLQELERTKLYTQNERADQGGLQRHRRGAIKVKDLVIRNCGESFRLATEVTQVGAKLITDV